MDNKVDQIKRLTQGLFVSGSLNILLLALFFYWLVREVPPSPYCERKPAGQQEEQMPLAVNQGNAEIVRNFRNLTIDQLAAKLMDTQCVENGYTQRDLALASLIAFHHFDLARALLGHVQPTQQRSMPYAKKRDGSVLDVIVYPGLDDIQFQAIAQYAQTERWPLTSQGLFQMLRKHRGQPDSTLADAFFLTPEFLAVEMLFNRSEKDVDRKELLSLLCQGDWKILSAFVEQQRFIQDLSPARRQKFLTEYIDRESRTAAYVMLKTDGAFAFKKLNDKHVVALLDLLVVKTEVAEQFALAVLNSPRSDAVLDAAATRLYAFAGEPAPASNLRQEALAKFLNIKPHPQPDENPKIVHVEAPKVVHAPIQKLETAVAAPLSLSPKAMPAPTLPKKTNPPPIAKNESKAAKVPSPNNRRPLMYVVANGDDLLKVAKRFNINAAVLKKVNHLKSDNLKPGTALLIP